MTDRIWWKIFWTEMAILAGVLAVAAHQYERYRTACREHLRQSQPTGGPRSLR